VLDELMRAGWPALSEVDVDGWVARFSGGVTQRANSVMPLTAPAHLDGALERVERLYAERGLPTIFQIGPGARPAELDAVLADRGYALGSPTSVQTARVADVLDAVPDTASVAVTEAPDQDWLDLWWAVDGRGDADALAVAVRILRGGPALYATVRDGDEAVAVARLALVGRWGGLYCMAVRPDARRRGFGAAVLHGLLDGARRHGVTDTWLQVRAENDGARRLYQRAGFTEIADYHYRSHGRQEPVQHVHAEAEPLDRHALVDAVSHEAVVEVLRNPQWREAEAVHPQLGERLRVGAAAHAERHHDAAGVELGQRGRHAVEPR